MLEEKWPCDLKSLFFIYGSNLQAFKPGYENASNSILTEVYDGR